MNRRAAIETRCVDINCFTREKPADRQRFKSSLAKPFLPAIDGDSELRGLIIERSKRRDKIRAGRKPAGNSFGNKLVQRLPSFFHGNAQLFGYFRVVWCLAGFHHAPGYEVIGLIQDGRKTHHGATSLISHGHEA